LLITPTVTSTARQHKIEDSEGEGRDERGWTQTAAYRIVGRRSFRFSGTPGDPGRLGIHVLNKLKKPLKGAIKAAQPEKMKRYCNCTGRRKEMKNENTEASCGYTAVLWSKEERGNVFLSRACGP